MYPLTRRGFLGGLTGFFLLPLERTEPQLILHQASIYTMNPSQPRAEAVAIADGRLLAIGSNEEVRALATARTVQVNLEGKCVVPGFIDAHSHPAGAGLAHLRMVDCDLRSIAEIQEALRERAARTPPGEWVLGFKYDDTVY